MQSTNKTIFIVQAEDINPNYPRYFLDQDAALAYAKRMSKEVGLFSWISKAEIPEVISENGVAQEFIVNDTHF